MKHSQAASPPVLWGTAPAGAVLTKIAADVILGEALAGKGRMSGRPRVFIRFVVKRLDSDSGRREGLFQAAVRLRESDDITGQDRKLLVALFDWFNQNLKRPAGLSLSAPPHAKAQAISWFKGTSTQQISRMRQFQRILERYGIAVEMLLTRPTWLHRLRGRVPSRGLSIQRHANLDVAHNPRSVAVRRRWMLG
jgi:hypothetical protein